MVTLAESVLSSADWVNIGVALFVQTGLLVGFLWKFASKFGKLEESVKNLAETVVKDHGDRLSRLEAPFFRPHRPSEN